MSSSEKSNRILSILSISFSLVPRCSEYLESLSFQSSGTAPHIIIPPLILPPLSLKGIKAWRSPASQYPYAISSFFAFSTSRFLEDAHKLLFTDAHIGFTGLTSPIGDPFSSVKKLFIPKTCSIPTNMFLTSFSSLETLSGSSSRFLILIISICSASWLNISLTMVNFSIDLSVFIISSRTPDDFFASSATLFEFSEADRTSSLLLLSISRKFLSFDVIVAKLSAIPSSLSPLSAKAPFISSNSSLILANSSFRTLNPSLESSIFFIMLFITSEISSAAFLDSPASFLTSSATTAKPFPASPALAASIAALRAKRLV